MLTHLLSKRSRIWLHLGMSGAVIEKAEDQNAFRLLDTSELRDLCHRYNDVLNAGLTNGYALAYEYNGCIFIDDVAEAHRAAPKAHLSARAQGLRIMHRSPVRGVQNLIPNFGLPIRLNIFGPSPLGDGVWQGGDLSFRWDGNVPMRN